MGENDKKCCSGRPPPFSTVERPMRAHALRSRRSRSGPALQPVLLARAAGARSQAARGRDRAVALHREGRHRLLGAGAVPVLVDGEAHGRQFLGDRRLSRGAYPERPSLSAVAAAMAATRIVNAWADTILHGGIDPVDRLRYRARIVHEKDKAYFLDSREGRSGCRSSS